MAKSKDVKKTLIYIGGLGGADTFEGIPARDLADGDVKKTGLTLDEILDIPAHSEYKLYEKANKSNNKPKESEVDNG